MLDWILTRVRGLRGWSARLALLLAIAVAAGVGQALHLEGRDGLALLWPFAAFGLLTGLAGRWPWRAAWRHRGETPAAPGDAARLGALSAAGWVSTALLLGLGGALFVYGRDGFAFLYGWIGGFVLLAAAVAPAMRAVGAETAPAYLGRRFGSSAEALGAWVAAATAFGVLAAHLSAAGLIVGRFLGLGYSWAVALAAAVVAIGATAAQARSPGAALARFGTLLAAFVGVGAWMTLAEGLGPAPQLAYLGALEAIGGLESGEAGGHLVGAQRLTPLNAALLPLCLALGLAAQPHLVTAYFRAESEAKARSAMVWALGLVLAAAFAAPAYAALAKLAALRLFEAGGTASVLELPDWLYRWAAPGGGVVLATACGAPAIDETAVKAACAARGMTGAFGPGELEFDPDMIVLAAPEMTGAPWAVVGVLGAAALAAAAATAEGAARALSASFGREVYARRIRKGASIVEELAAARWAAPAILTLAALWAMARPADLLTQITWALSLSAGGLFPALAFGAWWGRTRPEAVAAGIAAGFVATLGYQVMATVGLDARAGTGDETMWLGVDHLAAGVLGAALGAAVILGGTLALPRAVEKPTGPKPPAFGPRRG